MPVELIYLVVLLITICIFFIVLKRPIYEGMLAGYIVMVAMTGQWGHIWDHVYATSTNTLLIPVSRSFYPSLGESRAVRAM